MDPDHYQLVLDNRLEGRNATDVRLLVRTVETDEVPGPIQPADRAKGRILVFASMAFFAAVTGLFAVRIRRSLAGRET